MSLTEEERKALKQEFEAVCPNGVFVDVDGDRIIKQDWQSEWVCFKAGYIIGKKTKENLT